MITSIIISIIISMLAIAGYIFLTFFNEKDFIISFNQKGIYPINHTLPNVKQIIYVHDGYKINALNNMTNISIIGYNNIQGNLIPIRCLYLNEKTNIIVGKNQVTIYDVKKFKENYCIKYYIKYAGFKYLHKYYIIYENDKLFTLSRFNYLMKKLKGLFIK